MDDNHVYHRVSLEGGTELVTLQGNLARRESGEAFTIIPRPFQTTTSIHMPVTCFPPWFTW